MQKNLSSLQGKEARGKLAIKTVCLPASVNQCNVKMVLTFFYSFLELT
jgi:hypothetical protein